ncbi:giant larvae [Nesidiocoris tenuis]|uniref:Giant larvae n=1 Tax=Nesidiocoris tenuis TaxID=355587 RepID=A0ABN7B4G1_9HEMI|nr:giant larvae [Nesidiocoris tenuis]
MLKFIRGKTQQPSAERQKLQKELFAFRKTVQHGFPNKPTCLAWDPELRIMAIGTATGAVKVLGQPGVEFYGHHSSIDVAVFKLIFIPNQGRLVSLLEDNSLHLWEINDSALEIVESVTLEGKLKKVSSLCLDGSSEYLLLGTEGGNIFLLNLATFKISENIIYQDVVMQNVPEDYKLNPGAVEAMVLQPDKPNHVLIGYNRGLMVLWDLKTPTAVETYISSQGVESLSWRDGSTFLSSHNDGSYAEWNESSKIAKDPNTVYGPFPCKAITKILCVDDDVIVFSGGMQRASYSDRHTISVLSETNGIHVVFDFTSKVVDFFVAPSGDDTVLIVLAEEELVAIQLNAENTPMLPLPYLVSLHASVVTCSTYVSDLPQPLWDDIVQAGRKQTDGHFSDAAWPVDGGHLIETDKEEVPKRRDLLLTGHEDGSVRLWDAASVAMLPLYKFSSARILCGEDEDDDIPRDPDADEQDQDEWPPFKKVGNFDPYSDDPRLAVKKVFLCPETGNLVVAGTAGHVIVAKLTSEPETDEIKVSTMNIVSSRDEFVWKGHKALKVRSGPSPPLLEGGGFACTGVLQLHPPAAVTALAVHSGWGLIAVGTAHGVAVFDFIKSVAVTVKCTLNPLDMSGAGEGPISRRKSFKKSLRESFRRLRKGRSQRGNDKRGATTTAATPSPATATSPRSVNEQEAKPVERAIEARPVDDGLGSMVRCLTFARTYLISMQSQSPTLWVGTNNGTVYVFSIAVPAGAKRKDESVNCLLGKEIQLKHRAPVVAISLIDGYCNSVDLSRSNDHPPPHKVLICSEEQLKVFTVPQLKPCNKLKLTAVEGARVRRTMLALFVAGSTHSETCLLCLTNIGDIIVLSIPDLKRQLNAAVIRKEDINGISSLCFTERGEALYLHSSSELQRVSVSASRMTVARCKLDLPPGCRPTTADAASTATSASSSTSSSSSSSSSSSDDSQNESKDKNDEEKKNEEKQEIKENGISDSASAHDLSCVNDITVDSVKDHLANNINNLSLEEKTEVIKNETVKMESSLTTKTSTTIITTSESISQHINNSVAPTESA